MEFSLQFMVGIACTFYACHVVVVLYFFMFDCSTYLSFLVFTSNPPVLYHFELALAVSFSFSKLFYFVHTCTYLNTVSKVYSYIRLYSLSFLPLTPLDIFSSESSLISHSTVLYLPVPIHINIYLYYMHTYTD
jgi:hypothetical protein